MVQPICLLEPTHVPLQPESHRPQFVGLPRGTVIAYDPSQL